MEERIVAAGTFDRLHEGHFALFAAAFAIASRVEIWVTDDAQGAEKAARLGQHIRPFAVRCSDVRKWLDDQTPTSIEACHTRFSASRGGSSLVFNGDGRTHSAAGDDPDHPFRGRYSIFELHDAFGPTTTDETYAAIVCSEDTVSGCALINARRSEAGLPPMRVYVVTPLLDAAGHKLSSSAIRAAELAAAAAGAAAVP